MCFVRAVTASLCFNGLLWTFTNTSKIHFINFLLGFRAYRKGHIALVLDKVKTQINRWFSWYFVTFILSLHANARTRIDTNIKWVRWHLLYPSLSLVARLCCRGNRVKRDWWERIRLILRQVNVGFSSSTFEVHQYGNGTQWILIFSLGIKMNMITGFPGIIVWASESYWCDAAVDFMLYCILVYPRWPKHSVKNILIFNHLTSLKLRFAKSST